MSAAPAARPRVGFWREYRELFAGAWRVVRQGGWRLAAVYLIGQLIVTVIAAPVLHWLFVEALRAAGLHGVDMSSIGRILQVPLSLGLLITLIAVAFLVLSLQYVVIVTAVHRVRAGLPLFTREWGAEIARVARMLVRPASWPLLPYLFLLLPLTGVGFLSVLSQSIAIPSFISGELVKSTPGTIGYYGVLIVLGYVNARFALAIPVLGLTETSGGRALRRSWRLTRGRDLLLQLTVVSVVLAGIALGALMTVAGILPVTVTDAVAPAASPMLAAFVLAVVQVAGFVITGIGVVLIVALLVEILHRTDPEDVPELPTVVDAVPQPARDRRALVVPLLVAGMLVVGLSVANLPAMQALSRAPESLVLAHRGYTATAVENTISSLRTARDAGADFVEMDVMESADGRFIVMHDSTLGRLADVDAKVGELTFDELTAMTVHDQRGNSDSIPSLDDYVRVAQEIDQPLLIEIKLHGGERPDLVPRLVAELEALGALEENIYHSLDQPSVEELKRLRPGLTVGLTMAFAGIDAPLTTADFIVVEEWSYTHELRDAAARAGLSMLLWTVNDEQRIRDVLRDDIDGLVTDRVEAAVTSRQEMDDSEGLADVLFDALMRYVVIF